MTRWYRTYEGTVTDAKLGEVAMVAGCSRSVAIAAWHCILESAATANAGGVFDATPRRIAVILGEQPALLEKVFAELTALGMVTEGKVTAWSRRQYESDSSTERSKKSRERAKQTAQRDGNATATLQQQHATPPDTDTDTDISNHHTRDPDGWNQLEAKCREAAGWQNEPHPNLFVIGPIAALIEAGCILELDVLPTIRARSSACRGVKNWKYFISAIQQARDDRLGALTPATPSKPLEARYGTSPKHNTIANSFAVVDAAIADERNRIAALERELAGAGVGATVGGEGLKLVS